MYESEMPSAPWFTFAPKNFRHIMQRQIQKSVDRSLDAAIGHTGTDNRYANSFPSNPISLKSPAGRPYFIVGSSLVNCANVAAP